MSAFGPKFRRPSALIVYEGPSQLDGSPIVAIATGLGRKTANEKTGHMAQVWILRADMDPMKASKLGKDDAICGQCPHRRSLGGACYVSLHQAPRSVFAAYQRGAYQRAEGAELAEAFRGRKVRLGAYGDPAAVPLAIWDTLLAYAEGWTGYTHQWMRSGVDAQGLGRYCMASCDSERDLMLARYRGWRTFRVRTAEQAIQPGEFICPASEEGGYRRDCASCLACNGAIRPKAFSPTIVVHGSLSRRFERQQVTA